MSGDVPILRPITQLGASLNVSAARGRVRLEVRGPGGAPQVLWLELAVAVDLTLQLGRIVEALLPEHPGLIKHDR